ncbi:NLI interacting factor phosphatase [Spatholobus suberectus]|nr:NLI interacting factor phosphatase [Spatholobus suberectus]
MKYSSTIFNRYVLVTYVLINYVYFSICLSSFLSQKDYNCPLFHLGYCVVNISWVTNLRFFIYFFCYHHRKNVDRVIDFLMEDMKNRLLFCWDLSHCTKTCFKTLENKHKNVVLKDLRKLWDKHGPNLP